MGIDSAPCKKTLIYESKTCYNKTSKSLTYANGNVLRGGVKVWYNKMTAKTAVFGLQLRERDGRNEKETNAGNIGNA